jgi:hypothetical protein
MRGPRLLRTLVNPADSKTVTCVAAFPDGKHMLWFVEFSLSDCELTIKRIVPQKITFGFGMCKRPPWRVGARKGYHPSASSLDTMEV